MPGPRIPGPCPPRRVSTPATGGRPRVRIARGPATVLAPRDRVPHTHLSGPCGGLVSLKERSMPIRRCAVLVALPLALAAAGSAHATTRSSFVSVSSISGITVTNPASLQRTVAFAPGAAFTHGGSSYLIQDMIGFYALSDDLDFAPVSSVAALGNFKNDSSTPAPAASWAGRATPTRGSPPARASPSPSPPAPTFRSSTALASTCVWPAATSPAPAATPATSPARSRPSPPSPGPPRHRCWR